MKKKFASLLSFGLVVGVILSGWWVWQYIKGQDNNAGSDHLPSGEAGRLIGFASIPPSAFSKAKELGALTVMLPMRLSSPELHSALETAKSLGLGLVGRMGSHKYWQKEGYKIDFVKLKSTISEVFSGNEIASDPGFLGYFIIDEPCHENKWNISPTEFREFYTTVKEVDPDIKVFVNFGFLACLEKSLEGAGGKIADFASFTVGTKKLRKSPNYIADENASAQRVKESYPDLQIIPLIAVWEYPAKGESLPSADWVRQTGLEILKHDGFDGLMYFTWVSSQYMGDAIEDVADDPTYSKAFKDVFDAAKEKFGL